MEAAHAAGQPLLAAAPRAPAAAPTCWGCDSADLASALSLLLPLLPLDDRARAACVSNAWRSAAAQPALWAELDFERCAVTTYVQDDTLAALCARAGPALRSLRLDVETCEEVTSVGIVTALRDGGCVGVRRLSLRSDPSKHNFGRQGLTPASAAALAAACPLLEQAACAVTGVEAEAKDLAEAARALPGPLSLGLNGDESVVSSDDEQLRALLLRAVVSLQLSECNIDDAGAVALAQALHANTTLTELSLHGDVMTIGDVGCASLATMLRVNRTLTRLVLPDSTHGSGAAAGFAIGEALRVNTTLTDLALSSLCFFEEGAAALVSALRVNTTLKSLTFFGNGGAGIADVDVAELGAALRVNAALTTLSLVGNGIGVEGAASLGAALRVNATLTFVNLAFNRIADEGAAALADALRVNATLKTLDISSNDIGALGAAALGEALRVNAALTALVLGGNMDEEDLDDDDMVGVGIQDDGAVALAGALRVNTALASLELRRNGIGAEGAAALAEALRVNTALASLELTFNPVGDEGAVALAGALRVNTTLETLHLCGHYRGCRNSRIGDDALAALHEAELASAAVKRERGILGRVRWY